MRRALIVLLIVHGSTTMASSVIAAHHDLRVREFFPGTLLQPHAQYIEFQMATAGQNAVAGFTLVIFDSTGNEAASITFPSNVINGANQASMLLATPEAEALFGITADVSMAFANSRCLPHHARPAMSTPLPSPIWTLVMRRSHFSHQYRSIMERGAGSESNYPVSESSFTSVHATPCSPFIQ